MSFLLREVSRFSFSLPLSHTYIKPSLTYQLAQKVFFSSSLNTQISSRRKKIEAQRVEENSPKGSSNSEVNGSCSCVNVNRQEIKDLINQGDRKGLKGYLITHCTKAKNLEKDWDAYSSDQKHLLFNCKAEAVLTSMLPSKALEDLHKIRIVLGEEAVTVDLSASIMRAGLVTLAGEGGAVVGKDEYWDQVFDVLDKEKEKPCHIISIGGGTGDDAQAIKAVFNRKRFPVKSCEVVDPNLLAAWLSSVDKFYVATAQEYFTRFFERRDGRYVFHLGTILNVVEERTAIEILRQLAEKMSNGDILSMIMIDKEQFTNIAKRKKVIQVDTKNEAGLSRYVYNGSNKHYKTFVNDQNKFERFCEGLELKVLDFSKVKEKANIVMQVTFMAFKGIKSKK